MAVGVISGIPINEGGIEGCSPNVVDISLPVNGFPSMLYRDVSGLLSLGVPEAGVFGDI